MSDTAVDNYGTEALAEKVEDLKIEPKKTEEATRDRAPTTSEECKKRLEAAIKRRGLEKFYPEVTAELSDRAARLVNDLRENKGCSWEMASQFAILPLYDLAILIGIIPPSLLLLGSNLIDRK